MTELEGKYYSESIGTLSTVHDILEERYPDNLKKEVFYRGFLELYNFSVWADAIVKKWKAENERLVEDNIRLLSVIKDYDNVKWSLKEANKEIERIIALVKKGN